MMPPINSRLHRITALLVLFFTLTVNVMSVYGAAVDLSPNLNGNSSEILYEDESKRDQYTRHYVTGDGSYLAVKYSEQVNYQDDDGEWIAINNSFAENLAGIIESGNQIFKLKFSKYANRNKLVRPFTIKNENFLS